MTLHADAIRLRLAMGPKSGSQIATEIGLSQPTVTRALAAMGNEVFKIGQKRSSRYLLRDSSRGFGDVPVFRVDATGKVEELGTLVPVRSDGFVFTRSDDVQLHSDGLPWRLFNRQLLLAMDFLYQCAYRRSGPLYDNRFCI